MLPMATIDSSAGDGVARRVGVNGGHRAFVAGVHGLQHVEGFFAADLAHDDAVGAHTQAVDEQLPLADGALPSMLGGRVSRRTMFSWARRSSAASSMVTRRSLLGMYCDRMFSSVVLPAPVPPEMTMLMRGLDRGGQHFHHLRGNALQLTSWLAARGPVPKRRMDSEGPSSASGGMMALTREPSGRRASTMGEDSSTRRPTRETMRSMICSRWRSSRKEVLTFAAGRPFQ
jgi:hypothetical protein